jgi:hypothetical protein
MVKLSEEKEKKLRKLFEAKKKAVIKLNEIGFELDSLITEKYGFHYSVTDDDKIIDALDYGRNGLSLKEFDDRMKFYKKHFDNLYPDTRIVPPYENRGDLS